MYCDVAVRGDDGRKIDTANGNLEDVVPYLVKKYNLEPAIEELDEEIRRMVEGG